MQGGTALMCCGCATTPITGRRQFITISLEEEMALGLQAYREVLHQDPITRDPKAIEPMRRIVARMAPVAERAAHRSAFQWEVNVIKDDETVNAFVLPGGQIGVYTGMFAVSQTEAGMAIILGHEMGHAIARHPAERLSQEIGAKIIGIVLEAGTQVIVDGGKLIRGVFGLGVLLGVLLPYSRLQEGEADRIGLVLAAQAGYDPQVAVGVWERMAKWSGQRPSDFLSTHPEPERRIVNINKHLPQAIAEFRPHPDPGDTPLPSPQEVEGPAQ
jgi:predicted Zn-dependent protease